MKKRLLWLLFWSPFSLCAQQILDIGLFNNPVNSDRLEVRIQPTQTVSNGAYTAGVFTVRFLSSYGVTLTAPNTLNNVLYRYALANQGTDGTYNYYSFSFVSPFTVNWDAGVAYPLAILQINAGCGSGSGTFEIINNAWTLANNGNVYQELNGLESQNIIYQPTANAPLGVGSTDTIPPTITCPPPLTVGTDPNSCQYLQVGNGLAAVGDDNCPGFVIQYILSGATIDTVFSLNNVSFLQDTTQIHATITDGAGLMDDCTFWVSVQDMQAPSIIAPAAVTSMVNAAPCVAQNIVLGMASAQDNCPGVVVTNNAPTVFPVGVTTVVWTAQDAAGLSAEATQLVTISANLQAVTMTLSDSITCNGIPAQLSFGVAGGWAPYTLLYSTNGTNVVVPGYESGQILPIVPNVSTQYVWINVTDSIGCVHPALGFADTLQVKPQPTLGGLTPTMSSVCLGDLGAFQASGLMPNQSTTFQYTLMPGGAGSITGQSSATGTFTFPAAANPVGTYSMTIQSIQVDDCVAVFSANNNASYVVRPLPTISSIIPADSTACVDAVVQILGNGLLPDVQTTFQYTVNGVPAQTTVLSNTTGQGTVLTGVFPAGSYMVDLQSVTVGGCVFSVALSSSFTVDSFMNDCGLSLSGKITTETGAGVEEAKVDLKTYGISAPFALSDLTDNDGRYEFLNTLPRSNNFFVHPIKNDNPLNGVTTFDLVLISKHILGTEPLNSPYKMIAADANKSNSITTFDIVELRKLILGIYQNLPVAPSWRFIDQYYVFPDTSNPFVPLITDTLFFPNLQLSVLNTDWIGIKVGDLNNTAVPNFQLGADDRRQRPTVDIPVEIVSAGDSFEAIFRPAHTWEGYQFTLEIPGVELLEIVPSEGMGVGNFGVFEEAITVSYVRETPLHSGDFRLQFRTKTPDFDLQKWAISSRITAAEAYPQGQAGQVLHPILSFRAATHPVRGFELYQNEPNPFQAGVRIPFYLPEACTVQLTILDEMGNVIFAQNRLFEAGLQAFQVQGSAIPAQGLFFYQVRTAQDTAVRKMIRK